MLTRAEAVSRFQYSTGEHNWNNISEDISYNGKEAPWMAEVGEHSEEHLSHAFCSSVVRYSRLPRIMSGWVLRMYTDGDLSAFWENLFQCSSTVMENVFFLCLIRISVFQFGATGHLWGEFIFLLYSSCQLFLHIYNVPLNPLFCRINSPSSTLLYQVFQPFHISALVCWICSTLLDSHFMPPLYWWVQNWTQHSTCVSQVLSRGEGSPSSICRQHSYKWVSQ